MSGGPPLPLRTVVRVRAGGRRLTAIARVPFLATALHLAVPEPWADRVEVRALSSVSPGRLAWRMAGAEVAGWLRDPRRALELVRSVRTLGPGPGVRHFLRRPFLVDYQDWIARHDTLTPADEAAIRTRIAAWPERPTFAVVLRPPAPGHGAAGTAPATAREATGVSLDRQLYPYCRVYDRPRDADGAPETFVLQIPAGDTLAPHALYLLAEHARAHPDAVILSFDEDLIAPDGGRRAPYFRPSFSPDLLHGWNYLQNAFAVRRAALARVPEWWIASPYEVALRLLERHGDAAGHHVPFVLYHRAAPRACRPGPEETATLAAHLRRTGSRAAVTLTPDGYHRVVHPQPDPAPLVSLVVCTRDRVGLLRRFLDGVLRGTRYRPVELVVVDNQSREPATFRYFRELEASGADVRIVAYDHPFNFAAMNNLGVAASRGELVGLANNDLEVLHPDWLEELVAQAVRPEVGAVGAKLCYPDGTFQHAGVILGIGGVGGHVWKRFPRQHPGYFGSTRVVQDLSAVTAACLVMRRATFEAVGGLDAERFPVAFNDVDLCLRIRAAGLRVVWTPHAELLHRESASRGSDLEPATLARFTAENRAMLERWGDRLRQDPAYNPNLSLEFEDYSLAPAPRVERPWREPAGPGARGAPGTAPPGRPW